MTLGATLWLLLVIISGAWLAFLMVSLFCFYGWLTKLFQVGIAHMPDPGTDDLWSELHVNNTNHNAPLQQDRNNVSVFVRPLPISRND
jgi:hypothetical protein